MDLTKLNKNEFKKFKTKSYEEMIKEGYRIFRKQRWQFLINELIVSKRNNGTTGYDWKLYIKCQDTMELLSRWYQLMKDPKNLGI